MGREGGTKDEDLYALGSFSAGNIVELDVQLPSSSTLAPQVRLLDAAGNEIADEDGDATDGHFLATLTEDGAYFAEVRSWWAHQGQLYYLGPNQNWFDARTLAQDLGGDLVTINDQAEQDWLYEQFGSSHYWIGLNDLDVEGSFVWVSGEPVGYTNWCPGEPNDYLGEDTVAMGSGSQCWNDIPDNGGVGIVEIESPPGVDPHINVAYDNYPDVEPSDDFIHLYGWAQGSNLTVSIDDPATGPGSQDGNRTGSQVRTTELRASTKGVAAWSSASSSLTQR